MTITRIATNPATYVAFLRTQLGYSENPPGSNRTKYCSWYGLVGPWCAMFDSYVSFFSGNPLPRIRTDKGYAYVPDIVAFAQATGQWRPTGRGYIPKAGDRAIFSFGGQRPDHIAPVIENLGGGKVRTIEGNTNGAGSRTGGSVLEKVRYSSLIGFVSTDVIGPNTPILNTPVSNTKPSEEDDDMKPLLFQFADHRVFYVFGLHRKHVTQLSTIDALKFMGVKYVPWDPDFWQVIADSTIEIQG